MDGLLNECVDRGGITKVPAGGRAWRSRIRARRQAKAVDAALSASGTQEKVFRISGNPRHLSSEARRSLGPFYPAAYNISTTTTTEDPEAEYDPWAFPRMHGYVPPSPQPSPQPPVPSTWPNPSVYALPPQPLPPLSPRAPTDRGMEFGDRGTEFGDRYGDAGWTLEHRPMAAPRGSLPAHSEGDERSLQRTPLQRTLLPL